MPRIPKNQLRIDEIAPLPDGTRRWKLHGYILGEKIREQSHDLTKLEASQAAHEARALNQLQLENAKIRPQTTLLTPEQLRDAETAFRKFGDRYQHGVCDFETCTVFALERMANGKKILCR